ncbi:TonB-dependent receptor [Pasteurella multocida]
MLPHAQKKVKAQSMNPLMATLFVELKAYHGQHLATNSFEHGNKNLRKESSNNIELGFAYHADKWDYKLSLYQNKFRNYIYNEDLARYGNAFLPNKKQPLLYQLNCRER